MTNQWFRSWHGAPTDPKWLGIARKAGVAPGIVAAVVWALLDRASQANPRGSIEGYDADGLACFMGCEPDQIELIVTVLHEKEVLTDHTFTGWEKHQPKREDGSAERAKDWRERKRTHANASEQEKTLDTDTDTEGKEKEGAREAPSLPATLTRDPELAFDAYNDLAGEIGLAKAQALTTPRRRKIEQRLNECGGLIGWQDVLAKIRGSPFLRGDNDRGWRADLDFILQASSFTRLMEGAYDRSTVSRPAAGKQGNTIAGGFDIIDRAIEQRERELAAAQGGEGRGEDDPFAVPRLRQITG